MKSILHKLFRSSEPQSSAFDQEHALHVATATLLVEVCRADFVEQQSELDRMRQLLAQQFSLNETDLDELMIQARESSDKLVSIQHITRLLNEQFDASMKVRVVEMMWQVVYADGIKDRYEEHLIRQVSELLYLPHSKFIQARHKAEQSIDN
ncbi:MAG: TerB family tellurite resistance protein [Proteobacteria bacterium]|nr:TerB family tellurite resistance protein [Pseudomonadota bacterium]